MASPLTALSSFFSSHPGQTATIVIVVTYSLLRAKLTAAGCIAAVLTAIIHMAHPRPLYFTLLFAFFTTGTAATRVNHAKKATLTQSSTGGTAGEGARNASQVLANSAVASALILWDLYSARVAGQTTREQESRSRLVLAGVVGAYAAAAADTLSSELGILSSSVPFLVTAPWRRVPRGTNGGVTPLGLAAGLLGSSVIAAVTYFQFPTPLAAGNAHTTGFVIGAAALGLAGSVLDSVLGALCQVTVEDKASGRVIEGANGRRVVVNVGGSRLQKGSDLLNNNGVNFAMTLIIATAAMLTLPGVLAVA